MSEGFVSGGFFVFERSFFDYLDDDPTSRSRRSRCRSWPRDGELAVFPHEGFWMGMDTWRDYTELDDALEERRAPWKVWDD